MPVEEPWILPHPHQAERVSTPPTLA
jgi:hypothetical protein